MTTSSLKQQKFKQERKGFKISLFGNLIKTVAKETKIKFKEDSELAEDGDCKEYNQENGYKSNTDSTKVQTYIPMITIPENIGDFHPEKLKLPISSFPSSYNIASSVLNLYPDSTQREDVNNKGGQGYDTDELAIHFNII